MLCNQTCPSFAGRFMWLHNFHFNKSVWWCINLPFLLLDTNRLWAVELTDVFLILNHVLSHQGFLNCAGKSNTSKISIAIVVLVVVVVVLALVLISICIYLRVKKPMENIESKSKFILVVLIIFKKLICLTQFLSSFKRWWLWWWNSKQWVTAIRLWHHTSCYKWFLWF